MSHDPNQPPGGPQWPAPGEPTGGAPGAVPPGAVPPVPPPAPAGGAQGGAPDPVVYAPGQPAVPYGTPTGQTAWVPYQAPQVPTVEVEPPKKGGKGKIIGGIVGVAVLAGAGVFAFTAISGGHDGGAGSPEEATEKFVQSIDDLDILGAMDSLLPGERDVLRDRAVHFVTDLRELGILSDGADLGALQGIDVTFSDLGFDAVATNADDITDVLVTGNVDASIDGRDLPIGDLLIDRFLGGEQPDVDQSGDGELDGLMLTTVEEDGRWYVSLGYTVAEWARTGGDPESAEVDIPGIDDAIPLNGGDTPEGAIDNLLDSVEAFDLEGVIGTLDPRELGAFQRYAPLFIDDAVDQFAALQDEVALTFGDITYSVEREGSTATVGIAINSFTASTEDVTVVYDGEGQCVTVTQAGGAPEEMCAADVTGGSGDIEDQLDQLLPDDPELAAAVTALYDDATAAFSDLGTLGITVSEVDGSWYVSSLGTLGDNVITVLDALDRTELETLLDDVQAVTEAYADSSVAGEIDLPIIDLPQLPG